MNVGILGGGQLSRMLALSATHLDINFIFYVDCLRPELMTLGEQIVGPIDCKKQLNKFIAKSDIVTFENENIPENTLTFLETHAKSIYPCTRAIRIIQDRLTEKKFIKACNVPTNHFIAVNNKAAIKKASEELGFPFILKQRTNGYDGKGQIRIKSLVDIEKLHDKNLTNLIAEAFIHYDRELSVIVSRDKNGKFVSYDITENQHINGILFQACNKKNDPKLTEATHYLSQILQALSYVGTCAMEFFQVGEKLIANELAPRVHNSGHWTIEGAKTSQFENHLRAITGLPLGDTASYGNYAMYNLISNIPQDLPIQNSPEIYLHDYLKTARPNRKLGHITLCRDTGNNAVIEKSLQAKLFGQRPSCLNGNS